jgi:chromosome segregation ATPase
MITGRDTLQGINDHILQTQSQIESAGYRMDELLSRLNTLRFEMAEHYRQLAKFRLDELHADRMISRLDKADQAIKAFLDKRSQDLSELQNKLKECIARQQKLEQERVFQQAARDKAIEALQRQIESSKERLEQSESYRLHKEKVALATQVARRADEKAFQSEDDLASKGKPYKDDSIFMYLWQRRYMTPEYRANRLIRSLDNWVARLIDFKDSRANYHMLNELPLRLREHATKAEEGAQRQKKMLQAIEKEEAEKDGVFNLQTELEKVEKHLHQIDDDIDAEESNHQKLLERQTAFTSGEDKFTKKAIELLVAELEHEDIANLYREAQATPRPEDDAIVVHLHKLKEEEKRDSDQISSLKDTQQEQQRALEELTRLRRRFRKSSYDASNSSFPINFGLGVLLGAILRGSMSSGTAWDKIEHAQRWERTQDFPDFGGFSGPGRGGGFGSGGSFGSSGFRTGGSF